MAQASRRSFLGVGSLALVGAAVAACGPGGGAEATSPPPAPASPPPSPARTGDVLTQVADVPEGSGVIVASGQTKVVVTQPLPDEFVGLSAVCPHQGCLVNQIESGQIICPCHGSRFAIADGAVLQGPATQPLAAVDIKVSGDTIRLG